MTTATLEIATPAAEVEVPRVLPVSQRSVPWSPFGTVFSPEDHLSTADMLRYAGLSGWDVQVEDVPLPANYYADRPLFMTTRQSQVDPAKRDVFNTVGSRYNALQNEDLFNFGDLLLDGGEWVGAGSFKGGRVVFGSLKLDNYADVNGVVMDMYLVVSTSHDGTLAVTLSVTPINPWCYNTLIAAIKGAKQKWSIRHTQTLKGRMDAARSSLRLSETYVDLWAEFMAPLAATEVTDERFDEVITKALGPDEDATKNALTRWDKTYEDLIDIWYGPTIKGSPFENTQFAVWNALNEHHGWALKGRGRNAAENAAASRSGFSPVWQNENDRLLAIAQSA
jgi:phage/plasmid-like protein (TIGR03299 family)